MESLKHCSRCGYQLFLSAFGPCKAKRDGLMSYCKDCQREYARDKARVKNPNFQPRHKATPRVYKYHRPKTERERTLRRTVTVMLSSAKARARDKGLEFSLSRADIEIPFYCPILGIKMHCGTRQEHDSAPSLDRINPAGGYTPDNVQVICCRANRIKTDATVEELRLVYEYVLTHST